MANNTAAAKPQKCLGVAIFDFSEKGLAALKWAYDFGVTLPKGYKLCVILIRKVADLPPRERTVDKYGKPLDSIGRIEAEFFDEADEAGTDLFQKFVGKICNVPAFPWSWRKKQSKIFAKIYEGRSKQEALQLAINESPGLDTLIVGCAGPKTTHQEGTRTILPIHQLQLLSGCSILLVKVDGDCANNSTLSLSPTHADGRETETTTATHTPQVQTRASRGSHGHYHPDN